MAAKAVLSNFFFLPVCLALTGGHCPPTGPVLPPPIIAAKLDPLHLSQKLDSIIQDGTVPWNVSTTSFSIELTSSDHSFFEYHHTATIRDPRGTKKVTSDTVYRVGSITKVFNVLPLLLSAPENLDTPVARYVPELKGIQEYEEITLRMLASQIAGVPRDGAIVDLFGSNGGLLEGIGFPVPPAEDVPTCDVVGGRLCTRAGIIHQSINKFFDKLFADGFTSPPGARGAYSNQAFILLGWALENITGKAFDQILEERITGPLQLSSTGLKTPKLSQASIPAGPTSFSIDLNLGTVATTAGLYSTSKDLALFVRSIFNNKLLSPTRTRQWLKPASFAGGFSMNLGMPWEIIRLADLTVDGRPIDIYTKLGDVPGYSTMMFLVPDYEVGGAIIVSGDGTYNTVLKLMDIVVEKLVSEVDSLARTQASIYTGQYRSSNGTSTNSSTSSLSLVLDDGPGIKIENWVNDGKSILDGLSGIRGITIDRLDARLYPVGSGNKWRMALEVTQSPNQVSVLPSQACSNWLFVDQLRYAGLPVDEFSFHVQNGAVEEVHNSGLRVTLTKQSA